MTDNKNIFTNNKKSVLKQPITDGPHTTPELMEDGIPFLSVEAVFDGKIHFEKRGSSFSGTVW